MKRDQRIAIKNKDDLTAFIIIGIMIFGMLLVSFDLTEDPNLTPRFFFIAVCVLISQIWLFFLILRNPDKFDTSVFKQAFFPIYAIYLISIIISVSNALNVYEVIWGFLKTITFLNFLSVFILLFSKSKNYERIITKLITVYSIIIIAYGIYELLSLILGGKLDLENTYLVTAGFRLRNLYSQMLFLTLPFTIFGVYLFRGFWRHISLTATLSVIALIPMLMTRSVWFGITLATLSSVIVFFLYNKHLIISKKSINRSILFLLIIVVLISGSVVVYSRLDSFETFRYRINEAFNFKHGSAGTRLMLWNTTLDMIKNSPITGIGAENWKLIYPKYSGAYEYSPAGEALTPRRPHNDFLWVLSETGIIGCLLFIAIFSICFYYLFKSIKRADTKDMVFLLILFFGLTGFVGISFFSFPKERIEAQLFIHIIFGLILLKYNSFYPKIPFQKKHAILYILVPLLALSVVSTALGYIKLTSNMAAMKTKMLNNHRQYRAALNEIDKADMVLSPVDDKGFPLHAIRAFSYQGIENWEFAIRDNKLALQSCPYNAVILNNLALSYKKNEDLENAELVYNECRELNPEYTTALVNLAILYAQTDRIDKAYELLKEHNPETPKSAKYEDVLLRILRFKTYQIIETIDEELILKVLKIKVEKDKWLNKVHKKSIKNDLPLEKQILKKAIYILEKVDSTINKSQANILREKYNIHKGGKQ